MNLRLLRVLLRSADESIFVRSSIAGEAVDLGVGAQGALVVYVAAADGSDTPGVHGLAAVFYFGHRNGDTRLAA